MMLSYTFFGPPCISWCVFTSSDEKYFAKYCALLEDVQISRFLLNVWVCLVVLRNKEFAQ